jgi:D-alanyl-D-alanine carboxypeptidase
MACAVGVAVLGGAACTGDDDAGAPLESLSPTTSMSDPGTSLTTAQPAASTAPVITTTTSTISSTTLPPATTSTTAPIDPAVVPTVDAASFVVYDARTGQVLASSNADVQRPVGNLMKLLTTQAVFAAGASWKPVIVPPGRLADASEPAIGLNAGQELERATIWRAMMIADANDAARALAIDIAGSEQGLVDQMNVQAGALGLVATHAVNVTGLDADGQVSTASDLIRLAAFLMQNATFQEVVKRTEANMNGRTVESANPLINRFPGSNGIIGGSTPQSGFNIAGSASRESRRILVVTLGSSSEEAAVGAASRLLSWAFLQPY